MFPAPSPNSQAIFNLQSGGVTPSTADFQQSALRAAAQANQAKFNTSNGPTSQPEPAQHSYQQPHPQQQAQRGQQDIFGPHDVTGAANDLLSFAQATQPTQPNGNRSNGQFAVPNQPAHINNTMGHMPVQMPQEQQQTHHHAAKGSVNSMTGSVDTGDLSESGRSEQAKPSTRSRNKKGGNAKTTAGSRRKADDAPKGGANKKQKGNSGSVQSHTADEDSDLDMDNMKEELNEHGKKMTDEEKRKNFLERNRYVEPLCSARSNTNIN
jgi:ATF/CREB family transcription factor